MGFKKIGYCSGEIAECVFVVDINNKSFIVNANE